MTRHMPESRLNGAERDLQHSFRKFLNFNSLLMMLAVAAAYLPIRALPDLKPLPQRLLPVDFQPVALPRADDRLILAGAWRVKVADRRFGGISGLAFDGRDFLAVSDLGAVVRFNRPDEPAPRALVSDLRAGPGPFGYKWARDAEAIAPDPRGRGWWIAYEQSHSLWLYSRDFSTAAARIPIDRGWPDNRGLEGLVASGDGLLGLAESGEDSLWFQPGGNRAMAIRSSGAIADAARAPDGSLWLLLRAKSLAGIEQRIAPLISEGGRLKVGRGYRVPKAPLDNFEGMAIEKSPRGWRVWLISDDGHRVMARTLLVALDLTPADRAVQAAAGR